MGPKRPPCGEIERRIMRDWDAWSDGLEVVGASGPVATAVGLDASPAVIADTAGS